MITLALVLAVLPVAPGTKPFLCAAPTGGVYLAYATAAGIRFGTANPVAVSPPELDLDLGAESGPQMAVDQTGAIHIVYAAGTTRRDPQNPRSRPGHLNIYLSTSRDGGRQFGRPVRVNDDADGAEHRFPTLAVEPTGALVVTWLDKRGQSPERPDFSRVYVARSVDGGRSFTRNTDATRGLTNGICHCCKLGLAVNPRTGEAEIAFRNAVGDWRDVFLTSGRMLDVGHWQMPGCPMNGPTLAIDRRDRLHAVWLTGGEVPGAPAFGKRVTGAHKILYRTRRPWNRTWNAPVFLACGTHPRLTVTGTGQAWIVWEDEGIHLARVGGRSMRLTTDASASYPALCAMSDGRIAVAWQQWDADDQPQVKLMLVGREF